MFDVKKHLIKVQGGRQYLPVAARLIWFRTEHPDWGIETKAIAIDVEKQYAIFESTVYDASGKLMAKGTKMENIKGFGDWLEKAETGAIGRALAVCGYGTQFAPDLDESHNGSVAPTVYGRTSFAQDQARFGARTGGDPVSATTKSNSGEPLSIVGHDADSVDSEVRNEVETEHSDSGADGCESCRVPLKPNQLALSQRKFGAALCPDCQKKRKAEQAA